MGGVRPKRILIADVPLDWDTQSEEFGDHLREVATTHLGAKNFATVEGMGNPTFWRFRVGDVGLVSELQLQPKRGRLCVFVAGPRDLSAGEVDGWRSVVRDASGRMGQDRHEWPWAAIIVPGGASWDPGKALEEPLRVGPLLLRPGAPVRQAFRPVTWQRSPYRWRRAWSVVVEGFATYRGPVWSHDQRTGMKHARRQTLRLIGLLTVVLDGVPWDLAHGPSPAPPGLMDVPVDLNDESVPDQPFTRDPIVIPEWLDAAWAVLEGDPILDRCLAAYVEGARLQHEGHSSAAQVILAACIESLSPVAAASPCPTCKAIRGSTDRFEQGVAAVLSTEDLAVLGDAYGRRSRTAHAGILHGFESNFGEWEHAMFIPKGGGAFTFTMPQMHVVLRAAGLLLVRAITERARVS